MQECLELNNFNTYDTLSSNTLKEALALGSGRPWCAPGDALHAMLRVQMVSGSELCALDADVLASSELSDIRSLKRHLVSLCGASRFRQRLFCDRFDLEDDMMLKVPMDLQLVLLPFCSSSDKDIDILVAAASLGDVEIVEKLLQRPQDPDGHNGDFDSPLHLAAENGHAEVVQLLLEAEASVDLLAWQGES